MTHVSETFAISSEWHNPEYSLELLGQFNVKQAAAMAQWLMQWKSFWLPAPDSLSALYESMVPCFNPTDLKH